MRPTAAVLYVGILRCQNSNGIHTVCITGQVKWRKPAKNTHILNIKRLLLRCSGKPESICIESIPQLKHLPCDLMQS